MGRGGRARGVSPGRSTAAAPGRIPQRGDSGRLRRRPGAPCAPCTATNASTTAASNCVPAPGAQLPQRGRRRHAAAVGTVGDHRVVGVAHGDDARAERDLVAGLRRVGVAAAVGPLVARADERGDAGQAGRGLEDPLADQRVAAHERPLVAVERAGLVEDRVRDRELADVVQGGGDAHVLAAARASGRGARRRPPRARRRRRRGRSARGRARTAAASAARRSAPRRSGARRASARTCARRRAAAPRRPCRPRPGSTTVPQEASTAKPSPRSVSAARTSVAAPSAATVEQRAELVAAHPVGPAVADDRRREPAAEAVQERVAGRVAEGVVVALEAVEVAQHEDVGLAAVEPRLEVGEQPAAVAEAGQRVGDRLVAHGLEDAEVLAERRDHADDHGEQRGAGERHGDDVDLRGVGVERDAERDRRRTRPGRGAGASPGRARGPAWGRAARPRRRRGASPRASRCRGSGCRHTCPRRPGRSRSRRSARRRGARRRAAPTSARAPSPRARRPRRPARGARCPAPDRRSSRSSRSGCRSRIRARARARTRRTRRRWRRRRSRRRAPACGSACRRGGG